MENLARRREKTEQIRPFISTSFSRHVLALALFARCAHPESVNNNAATQNHVDKPTPKKTAGRMKASAGADPWK
jgi:hypothetical protein